MACCSPEYITKFGEPVVPSDLQNHLCLYAATLVGGNKWIFEDDGDYSAAEIPQTVEADDSEILKNIALAGGGIAYLPYCLIRHELTHGKLQPVLSDYVSSQFEINLYFKPRRHMPTRCANFKQYLLKRTAEIDLQQKQGTMPTNGKPLTQLA